MPFHFPHNPSTLCLPPSPAKLHQCLPPASPQEHNMATKLSPCISQIYRDAPPSSPTVQIIDVKPVNDGTRVK